MDMPSVLVEIDRISIMSCVYTFAVMALNTLTKPTVCVCIIFYTQLSFLPLVIKCFVENFQQDKILI